MAYKLRMLAEYCNIFATLALVVIMSIMVFKVLPMFDHQMMKMEPDVEEMTSMAYMANLCDAEGDECRPIMYHPAGNEPLSFD